MRWLRRVLGLGDAQMASDRWLNELARRESRIEFHGVQIRWPIRKVINEASDYNRYKLKRSA